MHLQKKEQKEDINKIKNDIIDKLLDDLTSFATSDSERKMMKLDLEAKIKQNLLITQIPYTDINKEFCRDAEEIAMRQFNQRDE